MGRYYKHPVAPIIDYSYKLPFQELFQAMQMKEKTQAQSLKTLRDSEAQMDSMFKATPGAKPDERVRKEKMEGFNSFVQEMSQQDLTKGDAINDINNYITKFARDEDVLAITQRNAQYDLAMKERKEYKKKNGVLAPDQDYFFSQSISDYNKKDAYDRDAQWASISGYHDYGKELRTIAKEVESTVTRMPGENGRFYYTVKNKDKGLAKISRAIQNNMSPLSKAALQNEFAVLRDQYARSSEEMPEGNDTFEEFVINKANNAAAPYVIHDQEMVGRRESAAYKQSIENAADMSIVTSPAMKISGKDVAAARNQMRQVNLSKQKAAGELKKLGFDVNSGQDIEEWLLQNPGENGANAGVVQQYQQLAQTEEQSTQFLDQINAGVVSKNPKYWEKTYNKLVADGWIDSDKYIQISNAEGKLEKIKMADADALMEAMVHNQFNIDDKERGWIEQKFDWAGEGLGLLDEEGYFKYGVLLGESGVDFTDKVKAGLDARFQMELLQDQVLDKFESYADEEEALGTNVNTLAVSPKSSLGVLAKNVQSVAQKGDGMFSSLESGKKLQEYFADTPLARDKIKVSLTDASNAEGFPIMWVTGYNKEGVEILSKPFAYHSATDAEMELIGDEIIKAGRLNNNSGQIRLGERSKAMPYKHQFEATGLTDTDRVVQSIKSKIPFPAGHFAAGRQAIINGIPSWDMKLGLMAEVTATDDLLYTLVEKLENGSWTPVAYENAINREGKPENRAISAIGLSKLSWLLYKEKESIESAKAGRPTAYYRTNDDFVSIQE